MGGEPGSVGRMAAERLDAWLGTPAVRTHHRRPAAAPAEALWQRATEVRLDETGTLGRLVRWRIPGLEPSITYHELFRAYPFCVLEEDRHLLITGLCGRIWTLARDYLLCLGSFRTRLMGGRLPSELWLRCML